MTQEYQEFPDGQPETPARRSRPWLKWSLRIAGGLFGLLLVVLVVARLLAPGIIRSQIASQASDALGTPVTVDSVRLSLLGGRAEVRGIKVANYDGFSAKEFVTISSAGANVSVAALLTGSIVVEKVWLDDPIVHLEATKDGRQTLAAMNEAMQKQKERRERKRLGLRDDEPLPEEPEVEEAAGEPAERGALLVQRVEVNRLRLNMLDQFAAAEPITSAIRFDQFSLDNLRIPASSDSGATGVLTVTLAALEVAVPEHFSEPLLLSAPKTEVKLDFARMMATTDKGEPLLDIVSVTNTGTRIVAETKVANEHDGTPQSVREFLLVLQNTSGSEGPKTLAQLDEEARAAARDERQERRGRERAERRGDQPQPTTPADGEGYVFTDEELNKPNEAKPMQVVIGEVSILGLNVELNDATQPGMLAHLYDTEISLKNLASPHVPGTITQFVLRTHPRDREGKLSIKASGEVMAIADGQRVDIGADIVNLQLAGLPEVREGRLNSNLELRLEANRARGRLLFATTDFRFGPDGRSPDGKRESWTDSLGTVGKVVGKTTIEQTLRAHQTAKAPPFEVPINYAIDNITFDQVLQGLLLTIGSNIGNVLEGGLQAITAGVGQVGEAGAALLGEGAGIATDAAGRVGKELEGVGTEVERGARKVEGAIRGLLGGGSRDREEP